MSNDSSKFDKIEMKLDGISDDITEIKVIMARNTMSLEEHIKRTNILEEKLEPVEAHVLKVEGATQFVLITVKILGGIVAAMSIIGALFAAFSK
jgi:hypothetical protein